MPRKTPLLPKVKNEENHINHDGSNIMMSPLKHQYPPQTQINQGYFPQQVHQQQFIQHPAYHTQPYPNAPPMINQIPNSLPHQMSYVQMAPSLLHRKFFFIFY